MNLIKAFYQFLAVRNVKIISYPWSTVVGLLVASSGFPPIIPTILAVVAMFLTATSMYIYNDICDLEMDRLNPEKIQNPLPSGKISVREAMIIVYVSGIAGIVLCLLLSLLVGFAPFILIVIYLVFFFSYSQPTIRLKNKFLIKEATPTIGLIIATIIGGLAAGYLTPAVIFFGIFISAFAFVAQPTLSDQQDLMEDRKFRVKTLASILNWKTRIEMLIGFIIVFMMITPLTYVNLGFNVIFPLVVVFLSLLFLRFLFPLITKYEYKGWHRAWRNAHIYYFGLQIAFIIGSLPIL